MVDDFEWSSDALRALSVGVRSLDKKPRTVVKLQPFEVVIAAVFARLRPDYEWWVTPNRPDGGIDFVGRGAFLKSTELGIDAAITIGGQCKKRESVGDLVGELSGSFTRMADALDPTFFVAAFSADLTPRRVTEARRLLEKTHRRHCHILDREQVEALIAANLSAAEPVIRQAFKHSIAEFVLDYFRRKSASRTALAVTLDAPSSVLAGEPFRLSVQITRSSIAGNIFRLCWRDTDGVTGALVSPIAAAADEGLTLSFEAAASTDPFSIRQDFEFVLYSVGEHAMGRLSIYDTRSPALPVAVINLPTVITIENLRPRFYTEPYRAALDEIDRAFTKARTGRVVCVAVAGAGGAGKSRLCQEVGLQARRDGANVVSARQAHTLEFPWRILADLLLALVDDDVEVREPAARIHNALRRLDSALDTRARTAIDTLFGEGGKPSSTADEQSLISVLVLLIVERARSQQLLIHLHDLHWCTYDVLEVLDRLIWQLDDLSTRLSSRVTRAPLCVLFLLEGRRHEFRASAESGWSTLMFERFIERLGCPTVVCRAFLPEESATFVARLFEQRHSAHRLASDAFIDLQADLIRTVDTAAGGNPFHTLEHVKLLQQRGVLAQNRRTGFVYMLKPEFQHVRLPATVFDAIEARWRYYAEHNRPLALLVWSAALVDDKLPISLFRHLWSSLAAATSQREIEAAEFLNLPRDKDEGIDVSFRHEHYFHTIRQLQVPTVDRQAAIAAYIDWFNAAPHLSPSLIHAHARVALQASVPDRTRVRGLLRRAYAAATRRGDGALAARVLATLLDGVTWPSQELRPLAPKALAEACKDEIRLCEHLIRSGRPDAARERIDRTLAIVDASVRANKEHAGRDDVSQQRFIMLAMKAGVLFHDRQPQAATIVTEEAVRDLEQLLVDLPESRRSPWNGVVMEVLDAHSAAIALSGDLPRAVVEARKAAALAEMLVEEHPNALDVIITSANILLCDAPHESESVLSRYADIVKRRTFSDGTRLRLHVNLGMTRVVLAVQARKSRPLHADALLTLAHESLHGVFREAYPRGRFADASAAALLLGLVSVLRHDDNDVQWFSKSVALAFRARQMETLWRAHINLAHSLDRRGHDAHDSANAALDIMDYSLGSDPDADRSPRFNLIAVPMAHAVRYLLATGDLKVFTILRKYPALCRLFRSVETGELRDDRDGRTSHEWIRMGAVDYVIF